MKTGLFAIALALMMLVAACSPAPAGPPPPMEVTIHATDIAYDVNSIEISAGQTLKLTFVNDGTLEHDFSIMQLPHEGEVMEMALDGEEDDHGHQMDEMAEMPEIHVSAHTGGGRKLLEFTPSTAGEYEYFCTVPGHKEAGMAGKLVVTGN